jgi:hypothetical protein
VTCARRWGIMERLFKRRDVAATFDTVRKEIQRTRYRSMPRTMLRCAIERFPAEERAAYLSGTIK